MKKIGTYFLLLCMLACAGTVKAQVKNLKDIKSGTPYLLRCVNDYGYCIYNPSIDDSNPTLGEALVDHPSGCVNDEYRAPIDPRQKNNQWYIISDGAGYYYLKNAGCNSYISNETSNNWGGWGGWGGTSYGIYFFTENTVQISIEQHGDGIWMFRPKGAADSNNNTAYLCAASHSGTAMANWTPEDAGSNWEILTVEDDLLLYHKDLAGSGEIDTPQPDDQEGLGDVTVEGDTRYFNFLDNQVIAIPEQFILNRKEDDQFITLTLQGDTTITLSKYALSEETTEAPGDLPFIESFKFNNKFNDQLYSDAEGTIDNEQNTIHVQAASISKTLVASIKLPDEEDELDTKVWVDGKRNISKETRRRFDQDITYTVARPRQYIYKVRKTQNEIWSTPPSDNEEPWIIQPITLTEGMLSTNWPSQDSDQRISNMLDGDPVTYFHSNWHNGNNWEEGSYYGDGVTTWPYLQIEMAEPVENFQFEYLTRDWDTNQGYAPQGFIISASNDGKTWTEVRTLDKVADQLPVGAGKEYTSPIIELSQPSRFIRLQLTESTRKNYLVLAEFSMSKVTTNPNYGKDKDDFQPELLRPAKYEAGFQPYGRDYKVHVDFPTDMTTAEYNLPRIDIHFDDGVSWNGSVWIGRYGKTYFEDATIQIDGAGIYPDMPETHVLIRGRGNSSWSGSYNSKNPYRIKFDEKVKPFGMTKGKSWVLLANKQSGSMTTNALAMKIADMVESDGCNHIIPVELYINGHYRGSYNFTEKVGFSNNSIDLEDDSRAAMLELDSYYDELYKYRDPSYNLYVNVKEPDFSDPELVTELTYDDVKNCFNNFTSAVKSGYYAANDPAMSPLDVQGFVRAWLVTDLTRNTEIMHPKSWYVYCEDVIDGHKPWHFGPVWDFDWSYGYEGNNSYFLTNAESDIFNYGGVGIPFFRQLVRGSDVVKKEYYRLWTHFIQEGRLDELIDYCDDLLEFANPSFEHNATKWSDGKTYAKATENAKNWLRKRANYIYSHLDTYDLGEDIIDPWEDETPGQPDGELDAEKPEVDTPDAVIYLAELNKPVDIFNLHGQKVTTLRPSEINDVNLYPGIYIINGKKIAIK